MLVKFESPFMPDKVVIQKFEGGWFLLACLNVIQLAREWVWLSVGDHEYHSLQFSSQKNKSAI